MASTPTASARLANITEAVFAADNVGFGTGDALLPHMNRVSQKFALQCLAARIHGQWIDVYKSTITDAGQASQCGRLTL